MALRVAILMGGTSRERGISLETGKAVMSALAQLGYDLLPLDVGSDLVEKIVNVRRDIDVIFNALHGRYGEDGCVQGLCDLLKLPYTHSGVLASALAMNKIASKEIFSRAGIPVPEATVCAVKDLFVTPPESFPVVVKPIDEGSSLGVQIITDAHQVVSKTEFGKAVRNVMVEEYIPGRELTVAILNDASLEVLEIKPKNGFYDFSSKYTVGQSDYVVPADIPDKVRDKVLHYAKIAHVTLGCAGVTRADFRYDDSKGGEGIRLLEINTQPGLTTTSLVPRIAASVGISFNDLIDWMVKDARCNG